MGKSGSSHAHRDNGERQLIGRTTIQAKVQRAIIEPRLPNGVLESTDAFVLTVNIVSNLALRRANRPLYVLRFHPDDRHCGKKDLQTNRKLSTIIP